MTDSKTMPPTSEPRSLPERIAADVVEQVTSGRLSPGDRITEQSLAAAFRSSRGPVRDALKLLEARGWIELLPRVGARVASRDAGPELETILISGAMLGLAYRFAVMKADDAELAMLLQGVEQVVATGRRSGVTPEAFGRAVLDAGTYAIRVANNRRIDDMVGPVPQGALSAFIPLGVADRDGMDEAIGHWIDLGTAFSLRDALAAERIGREMVGSAYRRIVRAKLERPDRA